jgi:Xaa-Pro aminopeptidase
MKYNQIPNALFIENRKKLISKLHQSSVAFFNSNDIMPTNADGTMGFRQNSDLFYLTGIDQEESLLIICPQHPNERLREILFLRETSPQIAIWEGYKYTKEHAREVSGIETIYWLDNLEVVIKQIVLASEYIYLNTNEHLRNGNAVQSNDDRFILKMRQSFPLHRYERLAPIMHYLRMVKAPIEIDQISEACRITELGFKRLLPFVKPGVMEYEIEAELIHEYTRNRSNGFAYAPIIASGASACTLHYIENSRQCKNGDLILLDVAAQYANYAADMTRVIPTNGKFSARQKQVYEAVLRTNKFAETMIFPGTKWEELQSEVESFIESECIGLDLFTKADVANQNPAAPLFKKYFMHGNSHALGLDVHDVWDKYRPFEPGMIFTNEPGIYIAEEGLGIRLENNILITETGNINLMANIPIEIAEIEELMNP